MATRPTIVVLGTVLAAVLLAACSGKGSASSTSERSTTTSVTSSATTGPPATTPLSTAEASTSTSASTSVPASTTTTAVNLTCQQKTGLTFAQVHSATLTGNGGLDLVASAATLVCGGPDDYHYNVASSDENLKVAPGALIQVLPITEGMQLKTLAAYQLPSYLPTDNDTRIFWITGPLDAITKMQEQFHP